MNKLKLGALLIALLAVTHYTAYWYGSQKPAEVRVVEKKSFYILVILPLLHSCFYCRKKLFVNDFVALNVETPIGLRRNGIVRFIRLVCEHFSSFAKRVVPNCFDYSDFRIVYRLNQLQCFIFRFSDGYYELIANWEYRTNGFYDGIIVLDGIADDGEAGDEHTQMPV